MSYNYPPTIKVEEEKPKYGFTNKNKTELHLEPYGEDETIKKWCIIPKEVTYSETLSSVAINIIGRIINNNKDWILIKEQVFQKMNESRYSFNKGWQEIIKAGYLRKEKLHRGVKWHVYNHPPSNDKHSFIDKIE